MAKILVFKHVAAEPLGTLDPLIRSRGHRIRFVNFSRHPDAEPEVDRYDGLIVLGGPMNVDQQDQYPHLRTELAAIERALKLEKPVLGICLGAQLLAHALGARVYQNPVPEIGWYTLQPTDATAGDPVMAPLQEEHPVFQWHGCTFDLPRGAELLATTEHCRNQAFGYGGNAYGFQFHMEMDEPLIQRWLTLPQYLEELTRSGLQHGPEQIARDTHEHIGQLGVLADQIFNRLLDRIGPQKPRVALPSR